MSLFPIQFFVHTLLTNKQFNVQVYNDGSLTCKVCLIQLCRVICRVLFGMITGEKRCFITVYTIDLDF